MGKEGQEKIFSGSVAWSVCMATTGWGLIYFNLLNIFNLYNLHTSLPLSARSARHPHSSRPIVICCTAQSTFLPISRFPVLFPVAAHFSRLLQQVCVNLGRTEQRKQFVSIFQEQAGRSSAGRSRKKKTLDIASHQSMICLVGCTDAPMPLAASQNFQEK